MQRLVLVTKLSTVYEFSDVVKQYSAKCSNDVLKNIAPIVLKRTRFYVQQSGGHFQHLLGKDVTGHNNKCPLFLDSLVHIFLYVWALII